jgi:TPR repeat protein
LSVPIYDYAIANEELAHAATDGFYPCCSKNICKGCVHSFAKSGNDNKCPFCNSDRADKTDEEMVADAVKRAEANDPGAMCLMGNHYEFGLRGLQQDHTKAMELYARSADLGYSEAHYQLGVLYRKGGYLKKAKFHFETAAMAGNEGARYNLGMMEYNSGNMARAKKHWTIAASAGEHCAMHTLQSGFQQGGVSRESMDSTLTAYNNACAEMRSEARDACIRIIQERG